MDFFESKILAYLFIYKVDNSMKKLKITTKQLIAILKTEKSKFPVTVIMKGIDQEELDLIGKLLKKNK